MSSALWLKCVPSLVLLADVHRMWYAIPLIVSVSLVYGATRHEQMWPILEHAGRFALWILCFLLVLAVLLWAVSHSL